MMKKYNYSDKIKPVTPTFIKNLYKRSILSEIKYYGLYIWWNWLDMLLYKIYWFFQRGFYGFSPKDTWNMDFYLATLISQMLKHFKKYYNGAKPTKKELDAIILGFEENIKIINLDYKYKSKKYLRAEKRFKEGMRLLTENFNYLWD